ncbi:hypothetical protein ASE12_18020 [Aeromicrobium sp. Root236]|nr:hypothetical protein ASE12_18020 [Aeromicrobium sp. Root236]
MSIGAGTVPPGTTITGGTCTNDSNGSDCYITVSAAVSCESSGSGPATTLAQFPLVLKANPTRGNPTFTSAVQAFELQCTPTITTTSLPDAHKLATYSQGLTAEGGQGSYTWDLVSGTLPPGFSLTSDGRLGGGTNTLGTWTFTVRVTESLLHNSDTQELTLKVTPNPIQIVSPTLPDGVVYTAYTAHTLAFGGDGPITWSIASGALPTGVTFSSAGNFAGTPTSVGTSTFTVRATDGDTTQTLPISITIKPMTITTSSLPQAPVYAAYKQAFTVLGGKKTYVWKVAAGSTLPKGLYLSTAGVLSGTPTVMGSTTVTIQVTDAARPANVATKTFTINVVPMSVATSSLPAAPVGRTYSTTLKTSGGKPTLKWVITSGALPAGLKLASGGQITGVPTTVGTSTFTVLVTDAAVPHGTASATLSLTVTPMSIVTTSLPAGTAKRYYTTKLAFSGGKGTLVSTISAGALPPGVRLATSGTISGTPTAAGTYTFTVSVRDASTPANVATRTLTLTIG